MVYCKVCNSEYNRRAMGRHQRSVVHQQNLVKVKMSKSSKGMSMMEILTIVDELVSGLLCKSEHSDKHHEKYALMLEIAKQCQHALNQGYVKCTAVSLQDIVDTSVKQNLDELWEISDEILDETEHYNDALCFVTFQIQLINLGFSYTNSKSSVNSECICLHDKVKCYIKTKNCIPLKDVLVTQWDNESSVCKYYSIKENHKLISFALLSKNDFDPLNEHTNPYTLYYIYTFPLYRHKGYALTLLETMKVKEELTAFSECDELFSKAGYIKVSPGVYRSS